ncbi:hypothetical protein PAXRUDRAFT_20288 [Paxillus rubicundulus Ve08.2h10]|uniref:Uncharacterized protein n=1 Tax=Paxillus rubicundulus Ve08.2h10 TaxID=930991 RepID=A0A0D0D2C3_9AGAM|nr:hypothetical protein PAXRUDRAFT_20288 [Paxillus rubicundulus Ve08.2h10]
MSMERATSMPCPPDSPWALTDLIMEYMRCRFHAELFAMTDPKGILPDINIPAEMIAESGEVIAWYLPAAVSQYNQVGFILEDVAE